MQNLREDTRTSFFEGISFCAIERMQCKSNPRRIKGFRMPFPWRCGSSAHEQVELGVEFTPLLQELGIQSNHTYACIACVGKLPSFPHGSIEAFVFCNRYPEGCSVYVGGLDGEDEMYPEQPACTAKACKGMHSNLYCLLFGLT